MLAVTAAALATVATPTVAVANEEPDERNCVQEFEEAQRLDMESFRDFDRETCTRSRRSASRNALSSV